MDNLMNILQNFGFPVTMCFIMFYYILKQSERHKQETDRLSETIEANTKVLTELSTLIKTLIK